jgi:hypothetical protein
MLSTEFRRALEAIRQDRKDGNMIRASAAWRRLKERDPEHAKEWEEHNPPGSED